MRHELQINYYWKQGTIYLFLPCENRFQLLGLALSKAQFKVHVLVLQLLGALAQLPDFPHFFRAISASFIARQRKC